MAMLFHEILTTQGAGRPINHIVSDFAHYLRFFSWGTFIL
jgi:hypothetical protein